jgi:DNA-directed RNA polymerase subunit RPC12/RpoP
MIGTQMMTDDEDTNDNALDLSVKKSSSSNNEIILKQNQNLSVLLSPPSSTSSVINSPKQKVPTNKRMLESSTTIKTQQQTGTTTSSNKRPLRFQCKHCDYKAPSTSLMQNHIYRHTDLTPYSCAYCGHKSTTKSTIMVHIELCHPNMEVKINENRVREQDFYRDLNNSEITSISNPIREPQVKKQRRSNQYDSESAPINGVAISLKALVDDENESSRASDDTSETENLEPILFHDDDDEQQVDPTLFESSPTMVRPTVKLKFLSPEIPIIESFTSASKESDETEGYFFQLKSIFINNSLLDGQEYLLVYNRPKQYYGSLYEPDKQ